MTEENTNGQTLANNDPSNQPVDYSSMLADAIKKKNEEILALKRENAKTVRELTDQIVNNQAYEPTEEQKPEPIDIKALRKALYPSDFEGMSMPNREYIEKTLALRKELIARGERDPFLPFGHDVPLVQSDIDAANRVAAGLQALVDDSQGSDEAFIALYSSRVI